jgi:hypothetical protein
MVAVTTGEIDPLSSQEKPFNHNLTRWLDLLRPPLWETRKISSFASNAKTIPRLILPKVFGFH